MGLYIDIAIGILALIVLIVWTKRGFAMSVCLWLRKIGCLIIAIVATIALSPVLTEALSSLSGSFASLIEPLLNKISGAGTTVSTYDELTTLMSSGALALLSSQADSIWASMESLGQYTISAVFGHKIFGIIVYGVTFLVTFILAIYIVRLMKAIFTSINKIEFFKLFDKILGCIFSLIATYILLVILLTGIEIVLAMWLPQYLDKVISIVSTSTILSLVHSTNVIGALVASMIGVTLPALV